jgi:hypothetical protein
VLDAYRQALLTAADELPDAARLADGALLCAPDAIAQLADIEPTQARVLLFSFEQAGLVRRGPDCTLEATLLLNAEPEEALSRLTDANEYALAQALFAWTGASAERQVSYRAASFLRDTGHDPRAVDPLLTRLAQRDLLLYRPYSRGVTIQTEPFLADTAQLQAIEQGFAARYQKFEDRLRAMLTYIQLKPGQGRCRSAYLVNYLTGRTDTPPCGTCDLCSPTGESLPWDAGVRLYGEPLDVDPALAILGAARDHDGWFGRWTIERLLLGVPQTTYNGQTRVLPPSARTSDHFGALQGSGADAERVRRTLDALIEGGYLGLMEKVHRTSGTPYSAVGITQRGRDALAGGIALPVYQEPGASA